MSAPAILIQEMHSVVAPFRRLTLRALTGLHISASLIMAVLVVSLLAGTLPAFLGYESYVVSSGSMEPTLLVGDIAVVQPVKASELKVSDIITYRTPTDPDTIVTHRLQSVDVDPNGHLSFQTRGDANEVPDKVEVDQAALLGKVAYTIPRLGILVEFSKRSEGRVLLFLVPGLLLALDFVRERLGRRKKAFAEMQGGPAPERARIQALLDGGDRALLAGHADLATRAADGVLQLDPRSPEAWIMKARAAGDAATRITLLRTALVVNPGAPKLTAALHEMSPDVEHAQAA